MHAHRVEVLDRADDDALSALSRTTSISYSFQPSSDSSISSSLVGEASRPRLQMVLELFGVVGDAAAGAAQREAGDGSRGNRETHRPDFCTAQAFSMLWAMPERAGAQTDLGHRRP